MKGTDILNSKKIFLQTDDYGVYLEALDYLHEKYEDKNIELITICPSWKRGTITYKYEYDKIMLERQTTRNKEYIEYFKGKLETLKRNNLKPIFDIVQSSVSPLPTPSLPFTLLRIILRQQLV